MMFDFQYLKKRYTTIENDIAGIQSLKGSKFISEIDIEAKAGNKNNQIYIIDSDELDNLHEIDESLSNENKPNDSINNIFSNFLNII